MQGQMKFNELPKSPITGKAMSLCTEYREFAGENEKLKIPFQYYKCEDSKETFITIDLDNINLKQLRDARKIKRRIY